MPGVELGDGHLPFGIDHLGLGGGQRRGLFELLPDALRQALGLVGDAFLLGDLAIGQRLHQLVGRHDVADQGIDRADVVFRERRRDRLARLVLAFRAVFQEIDDVRALRGVAEVVADGGLEDLVTSADMSPKRAMTLGASLRGMWMICETSRLNLKPSAERTVMVDRFASSLCASVLPVAQFSTTLAVGTLLTLCV